MRTSTRNTIRLLAATGLLTNAVSVSRVAWAQECRSNADCPTDFRCDLAPSSGSGSGMGSGGSTSGSPGAGTDAADSDPGSAPPVRPTAPSDGVGVDESTDAPPTSGSAPSDGPDPETENTEQTGQCERQAYSCHSNADCPEPAYCNEGQCQLKLTFCETQDVCGANYACTPIARRSCDRANPTSAPDAPVSEDAKPQSDPSEGAGDVGVSSVDARPKSEPSTAAGNATSSGGKDPTAEDLAPAAAGPGPTQAQPEPAPDEVECKPTELSVCFPAAMACTQNSQCPAGWSCETLDRGMPDSFEGLERACLPPGIAAVINNEVELDKETESTIGGVSGSDKGGVTQEDGSPSLPPRAGEVSDPSVLNGTQGGSEGSAGCNLARKSGDSSAGLWSALVALGIAVFTRRRSA